MKPCASVFTAASCGLIPVVAGFDFGDRGGLRRQHQFVHGVLRRAEFALHRKSARDIGGVAVGSQPASINSRSPPASFALLSR